MADTIDLQILLNSVDITDHVDLNLAAPVIMSAIDEELDTLSFTIQDGDSLGIKGWQEIVVKDGAEVIFGGYLLTFEKHAGVDQTKNEYVVSASDYGAYLEKVFIQKIFSDKTDAEIISDVFGVDELADFDGATYVATIRTIPRVVFNRKSVREVLNWLCEQSGGHWYMDSAKKLHYFKESEYSAAFDVTNDPTSTTKETVENVVLNGDASPVANLVEVVGGKGLNGDDVFIYTQGVVSKILNLGKRLKPWNEATKLVARRNDGGATTNLILNPSFEVNITNGWTQAQAGSGAAWAQDATKYSVGTKSLKITAGTGLASVMGGSITLNPGESFTVQAKVWCAVVGKAAVVLYDSGNAFTRASCYNRKTNSWELVTATYTNITSAALTVRCDLYNIGNDSTTICYFDAVQAEKLAWPSAYCDGSLGAGFTWSGTANNSTSARVNMPIWTSLTVKTGNQDVLGARDEVLYFESNGTLEQETYWPTVLNGIEVDGQEEVPIRAILRNYASYAFYGKWLKTMVEDTSIVDSRVARIRGSTVLAENAYESTAVSYSVRVPGLKAGQTQNVYLPQRGLDGDYLIQRVTTTIGVGGQIVSQVELGAADKTLVALLLLLKRAAPGEYDLTEDEIMGNILDFTDSVKVNCGGATVVGSSTPYLWDVAKWDFSKFGSE